MVINSGISTKSFAYKFNIDGGITPTTLIWSGCVLKAGESPLDIRCTVKSAITGVNLAKKFMVNAQIGDGSVYGATLYSQVMSTLNAGGTSLSEGDSTSQKFLSPASVRYPFDSGIDLPIYFTCEAAGSVTGGFVCFVMTYAYTKF